MYHHLSQEEEITIPLRLPGPVTNHLNPTVTFQSMVVRFARRQHEKSFVWTSRMSPTVVDLIEITKA